MWTFAAAFAHTAPELAEGSRGAREQFAQLPELTLSDDQRRDLATSRFPALQGVAALLCRPLGLHPEIEAASHRAPLLDRTVRLDQALHRLVFAGELLWRGGESGELLSAAAARAACDGVVKEAQAQRDEPQTPAQARFALRSLFSEPERLEAAIQDQAARERDGNARAEGPLRAQISAAEDSAAMARVIEAFLQSLRRLP